MRIDRRLVLLIAIAFVAATKGQAQVEDISSRFYFPGSLGMGFPFTNNHTHLNNGLSINTAIEYRPTYSNDVFFRIDYDALNNNYTAHFQTIPTNIVQGKLSTDFLVFGAGYRHNFARWGIYGLLQPGLGIHSFNQAVGTPNGVMLRTVSNNRAALKADAGIEYYVTHHFALVFDPSFYKIFSHSGFNTSHSQFGALNIGLATTIF
ncbi:MAG TPA: outer membrane beta-barrel protein [Mucilaginibacter sp.]|nr:outer membrane beta-barrel protein [Mucilaginibacter sp.]